MRAFRLLDLLRFPFTPPATYASQANTGYEAVFEIGDSASPPAYNPIVEIKNFNADPISMPEILTTHLLSPLNTEEMIPGMIKPGKVSFTGNLIGDATQTQITTLAQAQTIFPLKIMAPVARKTKTYTLTGNGFISSYKLGPFETGKPIEFQGEIQMTGAYTENVA